MTPIEVVEAEAVAHGLRSSKAAGAWFLLGYLVGREWVEGGLADETRLRAWLGRYLGASGRRRRGPPPPG